MRGVGPGVGEIALNTVLTVVNTQRDIVEHKISGAQSLNCTHVTHNSKNCPGSRSLQSF